MPVEGQWQLVGFGESLDEWIEQESPPDWLRLLVTSWVLSRIEDPYVSVRRQAVAPNLWFGVVPGSSHRPSLVVTCSYWVEETAHLVRCDRISTLSAPF